MNKYILILLTICIASCKNNDNEAKTTEATNVETKASDTTGTENFLISRETSVVKWLATKISGSTHYGSVAMPYGRIMMRDGKITFGEFKLDMNDIKVVDIEDKADNEDLVNHLKNEDFFDTHKFPTGQFTVANISDIKNDSAVVTGNLVMKDKVNQIEFPAYLKVSPSDISIHAAFSIDRTKWGINYHSGATWKDKMIKDNIDLEFDIKLTRVPNETAPH
jgi:polyisoprenoid-binding protein YceI